jgi:hypothetical protein
MWTALTLLLIVAASGEAFATPVASATTTTLTVNSGGTAVTSVSSGSLVTLSASVSAGGTALTRGLVRFCDAAATYCTDIHVLGTAQLTSAGTAVLALRPTIGSHSYKAVFAGTTGAATSTSSAAGLTVTGTLSTTTGLTSSGVAGSYTLQAVVRAVSARKTAPTGTVTFVDTTANTNLGVVSLAASTSVLNGLASAPTPGAQGAALMTGTGMEMAGQIWLPVM